MAGKVFVDTNILLRATIAQFPQHQQAKQLIDEHIALNSELWINRQVIREYIAQATRPQAFMNPIAIDQIEVQVAHMQEVFKIGDETAQVTVQLMQLLKTYPTGGRQVHDANIVATMLAYQVDTLLTINVEDFKRFADKIRIISLSNP